MFLLRRPVEVREDGYVATYTPFMIQYNGKDVYAAFATAEMAMYFVRAGGLDKAYEAVALSQTDPAQLRDADHALVLRSEVQVGRLLSGKITGMGFARNLLRVR